jgi:hypothetical protein
MAGRTPGEGADDGKRASPGEGGASCGILGFHDFEENEPMKALITTIAAIIGLAFPALPVWAGPATDALAVCLTDNTTGKDLKSIVLFVFGAMAAHPEFQALSNITPEKRAEFNKTFAALFTRLLTENCAEQTRAADKEGGMVAINNAFGVLSSAAMAQTINNNPQVVTAMSDFDKYVDRAKLNAVISRPR